MAVTNDELAEAARRYNDLSEAMGGGLCGVYENRVQLIFSEFCRRFPDRSAWAFKPWGNFYPNIIGEHTVKIDGVEFFAVEHKQEGSK